MEPQNIDREVETMLQTDLNKSLASYSFAQLDSLDVIKLILSIETRFNVSIELSELTPKNMGDPAAIVQFLKSKR